MTIGGITNGNDLVAAYLRHSTRFPNPLVEIVLGMVDVGDREQEYSQGYTTFVLKAVYNALRAWLAGFGRKSRK
jgi:hypothetical protein